MYGPKKVHEKENSNEIVGHHINGDNIQNTQNEGHFDLPHIIEVNNFAVETKITKEQTDFTTTKKLEPSTESEENSLINSKNCQQPPNETLNGSTNHSMSSQFGNPENMSQNCTSTENEDSKFYELKSVINNPKNNHENEPIISEILKRELRVKLIDFSICHCSLDKPISTHYCNECTEGFCSSCSKAHQRFKVTRKHYMHKINYFCKCKNEEKLLAAKFCQECSEFFCTYCISAHQRLIVTKNHNLKPIFQIAIKEIKAEPDEDAVEVVELSDDTTEA